MVSGISIIGMLGIYGVSLGNAIVGFMPALLLLMFLDPGGVPANRAKKKA